MNGRKWYLKTVTLPFEWDGLKQRFVAPAVELLEDDRVLSCVTKKGANGSLVIMTRLLRRRREPEER